MPFPSDFDGLLEALRCPRKADRKRAAKALGVLGDARAVEPLKDALADAAVEVRRAAVDALGRLKNDLAVEALVARLDDPDHGVRVSAGMALRKLSKAVYAPVLEAYRTGGLERKREAIEVLAKFKNREVTELLLDAIQSPDFATRLVAARSLGHRKEKRALEWLIRLLREDPAGRPTYFQAITAVGDPSVLEEVAPYLTAASDFNTVQAAYQTMRTLDNPAAVDLIQERLQDESNPDTPRLQQMVAATDLMNEMLRLRNAGASGQMNIALLLDALQIVNRELHDQVQPTADPERRPADPAEVFRRVEQQLRELRHQKPR